MTAVDMSRISRKVRTTTAPPPAKGGWIPKTHPGALQYSYGKPSSQSHRVFGKRVPGGAEQFRKVRKWQSGIGKVRGGLVAAGGYLWATEQGQGRGKGSLSALSIGSGSVAWKTSLGGECWSTPALSDGRVVVGCDDGKVYCFK